MVIKCFQSRKILTCKGNILQMCLGYFVLEQLKADSLPKATSEFSVYQAPLLFSHTLHLLGLISHPLKPVCLWIRESLHFLSCTVTPLQNKVAKSVGNITALSGKHLYFKKKYNSISYHRNKIVLLSTQATVIHKNRNSEFIFHPFSTFNKQKCHLFIII